MKLSVSLAERDVAYLDAYVQLAGLQSRSAALQRAIGLLREERLVDDYADAYTEWRDSGEESIWSVSAVDGLSDAAR